MDYGPLHGVRVTDFTQVWAGPYTTMLLGFMGAEIIKIESRKRLDGSRLFSITTRQRFSGTDESPVYNELNLNKLGITLDLGQPKAIELIKRLIAVSDVAVNNFRPGVMDKLGLSYDALREFKPDLIYLASSAFGSVGPERGYAGYAPSFAGLSGLASITGYADGPPYPMRGRLDLVSGAAGAFAVVAALVHRLATGEGQHIDHSATESISVLIGDALMDYTMNKKVRSRNGNRDDTMAPHNCYRCQGEDKWISIAVDNENEWNSLCSAMGNPDWCRNGKFSAARLRKQHEDELDSLISEWTIKHSHYEIMNILQSAGVAAVPSLSNQEIYDDPHLNERDFAATLEHSVIGKQSVLNPPWKLSETPAKVSLPGPLLGEHNDYVLGDLLGLSADEIAQLKEEKVVY